MKAATKSMSQPAKYALLLGILLLGIFLRFHHFAPTPPGLFMDEAIDGNNATEVARTGEYQVFYPEDNGREGLYVNLIAVLLRHFHAPHEVWVIRLPAAVAGVLTIPGLYLLVEDLFGAEAGLFAAFFLATSFWHINFSRIGFRAILAPLFLVWTLYLLLKSFQTEPGRIGAWCAGVAGIVYALGFYTYIAYRITPLLLLLFIPMYRRTAGFWKRAGIFALSSSAVAAPLGWYFWKHPLDFMSRVSQISVLDNASPLHEFGVNLGKTALMFNFFGDQNWRHNVSGAPQLFWPVGLLFLLGIAYGLWQLAHAAGKPELDHRVGTIACEFGWVLVFLWMLLAALPAAIADEGVPHSLRALLMAPPAMIFAGVGAVWLHRRLREKFHPALAGTVTLALILAVGTFGYVEYFVQWGENRDLPQSFTERWVNIGKQIQALPRDTPKYVVVSTGGPRVRGVPVLAQTTMFVTDSFLPEQQDAENIHYILPDQATSIPAGAAVFYIR